MGTQRAPSTACGGPPPRSGEDRADWIMPQAEVKSWLERARAGERLVYAHGRQLIRGETSLYVRDLALAGAVDPTQTRNRAGGFDYTIQKRGNGGSRPAPRAAGASLEEASDIILRTLTRQANLGLRAASDSELAKLAGLATKGMAAWRVRKLVQRGLIRTEAVTTGPEAGWRIVTITASGHRTAGPPSWHPSTSSGQGQAKAQERREAVK